MRGRIAALAPAATAAALAACGTSTALTTTTATSAVAHCAPAGAKVRASSSRAQVYALHGLVYGCDAATGRRTTLGHTTSCIATTLVDRVALAGDVVGYGVESCGVDAGTGSVLVRRLSDGKQLSSYDTVVGFARPESYRTVTSIVIKRDGSVAWIGVGSSIVGGGSMVQVRSRGKLLDSGAGINPRSLRLQRSTLTWRDGGTLRSATLR